MVRPKQQVKPERELTLIHQHLTTRHIFCSCYVPSREEFFFGFGWGKSTVYVFKIKTKQLIEVSNINRSMHEMYMTQDQTKLGLLGANNWFYLLNIKTRQVLKSFKILRQFGKTFQFSERDEGAYMVARKSQLNWIDFKTGKISNLETKTLCFIERDCFTISANRRFLYGSGRNSKLGSLNLKKGLKYRALKVCDWFSEITYNVLSKSEDYLFSGNQNCKININRMQSLKLHSVKQFNGVRFVSRMRAMSGFVIGGGLTRSSSCFATGFPFRCCCLCKSRQESVMSISRRSISLLEGSTKM